MQQYDQNSQANNMLGFDVTTRIKRTQLFASVLLDDIQLDKSNAGDKERPSYCCTLGAQGGSRALRLDGVLLAGRESHLPHTQPRGSRHAAQRRTRP